MLLESCSNFNRNLINLYNLQQKLCIWYEEPSIKTSAKSCTWKDTTKEPRTGWARCDWGATLLKVTQGVLVGDKWNTSQQCSAAARKTKGTLGCIPKGVISRDTGMVIPLHGNKSGQCLSGLTGRAVSSSHPHYSRKMWTNWRGSKGGPQR